MLQYHKGEMPNIFYKCFSKLDKKHKYETRLNDTKNYFLSRFNLKKIQKQLKFTDPKICSQLSSI